MTTKGIIGVVFRGFEKGVGFLHPCRQQYFYICRVFRPGYKEQVWRILDSGMRLLKQG
jgi:hypothetical protein